ncbi:hypothetical protein M1116_01530 [Patescibacteria group bacterium]|nr:hypothetical protein [Patescibacteria group bacterium]
MDNKELLPIDNFHDKLQSDQQGIYDQINHLLSSQDQQEKIVKETRNILGVTADILTDSEILDLANEVQYVVDNWLEEFEKQIFEGKTLTELLG